MENKILTQKDLQKGDIITTKYFEFCYGDFKDISLGNYYTYFIPNTDFTIMAINKNYTVLKKNDEAIYKIDVNHRQVNGYRPYVIKTSLLLEYLNKRNSLAWAKKGNKLNRAYYADLENLHYNSSDNSFSYENAKNALSNINSKIKETKLDKTIAGYGDFSITGERFTDLFGRNNQGK